MNNLLYHMFKKKYKRQKLRLEILQNFWDRRVWELERYEREIKILKHNKQGYRKNPGGGPLFCKTFLKANNTDLHRGYKYLRYVSGVYLNYAWPENRLELEHQSKARRITKKEWSKYFSVILLQPPCFHSFPFYMHRFAGYLQIMNGSLVHFYFFLWEIGDVAYTSQITMWRLQGPSDSIPFQFKHRINIVSVKFSKLNIEVIKIDFTFHHEY